MGAEIDGQVVGSVQLELCGKQNGRHRAELQKLFVLQSHRGQGIAAALIEHAEAFARASERSLLTLDTQSGSAAERLYQRLGWQRSGEIPDFAASPNGALHATVYYFKPLA